jgi:glycosyltransferase involved in cell wall biosynthesis
VADCILIPAYNAAATLRPVVEECLLHGLPLVVVDDGSRDGTAAALEGLAVTVLHHDRNRGKGAALRTGFDWALADGYTGIITLDADGQHDPTAIPRLAAAAAAGQFGILLASRQSQFEQMAGLRKHWNRFGVWCMRKRTGFEISDSQSGFRYYRTDLLRAVQLEKDGYDLEMELLMKCWRAGFRIGCLPVPARVADGRATSHYRAVRDTWNICMTFLRYM